VIGDVDVGIMRRGCLQNKQEQMIKFGAGNSSLSSAKIFRHQGIHIIEDLYVCADFFVFEGITHDAVTLYAVSNFDNTESIGQRVNDRFTIFSYIISAQLSALTIVFNIIKSIISASFDNYALLSYFTFMSLVKEVHGMNSNGS
jgi:hypothetical protein